MIIQTWSVNRGLLTLVYSEIHWPVVGKTRGNPAIVYIPHPVGGEGRVAYISVVSREVVTPSSIPGRGRVNTPAPPSPSLLVVSC